MAVPPAVPSPRENLPPASASTNPGTPATGQHRTKTLLITAAVAVVIVGGVGTTIALVGGGGTKHHTSSAIPSAAVAPPTAATLAPSLPARQPVMSAPPISSTAPATNSSAPSTQHAAAPTFAPGDIVLSAEQMNTACGGGNQGQLEEVLPNGTAVLHCSDEAGDDLGLAAVVARTDNVLWTRTDLPGSTDSVDKGNGISEIQLSGGGSYLYFLHIADHPAQGLKEEYYTRAVTAVEVTTGKDVWTRPLERADRQDNNIEGSIDEQNVTGRRKVAVVKVDQYTGFDADTGSLLLERADLATASSNNPFLAGFDRTLDVVANDNGQSALICTDLQTGKRTWSTPVNNESGNIGDTDDSELDGSTYWFLNNGTMDGFDMLTGKHVAHSALPASFENPLVTPKWTVAQVGSSLRLYQSGQWSTPVWSVPSDGVTPDIVTSKVVVVEASAGIQVLDARTGNTLRTATPFEDSLHQSDVTDGLVQVGGDLVEVGNAS